MVDFSAPLPAAVTGPQPAGHLEILQRTRAALAELQQAGLITEDDLVDPTSDARRALGSAFGPPTGLAAVAEAALAYRQDRALEVTAPGASIGSWALNSVGITDQGFQAVADGVLNPLLRYVRGTTIPRPNAPQGFDHPVTQGLSSVNSEATPLILFQHEGATDFEVVVYTGGEDQENVLRVRVDGRWINPVPLAGPTGDAFAAFASLPITIGDAGLHEIGLEFSGRRTHLAGIQYRAGATITASTRPLGPRLVVIGDSGTSGDDDNGRQGFAGNYHAEAGRLLGLDDTLCSGIGGTGWLANAGGGQPTVRERLQDDVIDQAPDWVHFAMGDNDVHETYEAIHTEVLYAIDTVRTALPDAIITLQSPMANYAQVHSAVQDAAAARHVPYVNTLGWFPAPGEGDPLDTGTAWLYTTGGGAGGHLNDAGHRLAGRRLAAALLAAPLPWDSGYGWWPAATIAP